MQTATGLIFSTLRRLTLTAMLAFGAMSAVHADAFSDANRLLQANQPTQALAAVERYLKDTPSDVRMRFLKSLILRRQGQLDEAVTVLIQLTQDFPELAEPYNNLAVLYASQGQFEKARSALEAALRNNPGYAIAHENLGDVYAKLAGQAYARSLELDGANARLQLKLTAIEAMLRHDAGAPTPAQ